MNLDTELSRYVRRPLPWLGAVGTETGHGQTDKIETCFGTVSPEATVLGTVSDPYDAIATGSPTPVTWTSSCAPRNSSYRTTPGDSRFRSRCGRTTCTRTMRDQWRRRRTDRTRHGYGVAGDVGRGGVPDTGTSRCRRRVVDTDGEVGSATGGDVSYSPRGDGVGRAGPPRRKAGGRSGGVGVDGVWDTTGATDDSP